VTPVPQRVRSATSTARFGRWIAGGLAAALVVIAATAVAIVVTDHPAGDFTRDIRSLCAAAGTRLPYYTGAISQCNVMVWAAAGALALVASYVRPHRSPWLAAFGLFLLVLAADDALTLHEDGPNRPIPEKFFYVAYALAGLALLATRLRHRFDETTLAFVVGGALLAVSAAIDQTTEHRYFAEDSLKLLGAAVWLVVPLIELARVRELLRARADPEIRLPDTDASDARTTSHSVRP
jgi:hypothetical protein